MKFVTNREIQENIEKLLDRPEYDFKVNNEYLGCRILITGAGSIGSSIAKYCKSNHIMVIDSDEAKLHRLKREIPDIHVKILNILDHEELDTTIREFSPEYVFHTAALKFVDITETNLKQLYMNNIQGTRNVYLSSVRNNVKVFVFTSTDKAASPTSFMGKSKYFSELELSLMNIYHRDSKTKLYITRYGNVLFSTGSILPIVHDCLVEETPILLTDNKMKRFFITMKEAAQFTLKLPLRFAQGTYYFEAKEQSVKELIVKYCKLLGVDKPDFKIIGNRCNEKLREVFIGDVEKNYPTNEEHIYEIKDKNIRDLHELKNEIYKIAPELIYNDVSYIRED